jgi:hypothetical protein
MTRHLGCAIVIALAIGALGAATAGAATTSSAAGCSTVVKGQAWKIRGLGSGSSYFLKATGMPCATAKTWAIRFSKETETGETLLKGPAGFKCVSDASPPVSGDRHVYDGSCQKGTPATAIFVWAPKPS